MDVLVQVDRLDDSQQTVLTEFDQFEIDLLDGVIRVVAEALADEDSRLIAEAGVLGEVELGDVAVAPLGQRSLQVKAGLNSGYCSNTYQVGELVLFEDQWTRERLILLQ
jgi:hypothetical protein